MLLSEASLARSSRMADHQLRPEANRTSLGDLVRREEDVERDEEGGEDDEEGGDGCCVAVGLIAV